MNIIALDKVGLLINNQHILQNITLSIEENTIIGIAGPSGSGKSSLLRLLNLLMSPTSGTIFYHNKNIMDYNPIKLRQEIGYVLQKPYLFDGTVLDNLEYPYHLHGLKVDKKTISAFLEKVHIPLSYGTKTRHELSGGEQQRIAFIRSLLIKPKVLLLDEITAALDENTTILLENFINDLHKHSQITVIFVTHNSSQLHRLAQKVIYIEKGQVNIFTDTEKYFAAKENDNE